MSKITSKNLHYDSTLPPFLARLQANNSSSDGRHEFAAARPKRARNPEDEAEDEPVYFDEDTKETFTKGEWEQNQKDEDSGEKQLETEGKGGDDDKGEGGSSSVKGQGEKVAAIGATKKRKAGKVVGGVEDTAKEVKESKGDSNHAVSKSADPEAKRAPSKPKAAKKEKKIKLSFGDE